tara:strand:- start:44 stop:1204 length:1161 start_codon:yes stop_codon:yes gene_type:complete
MFINDWLDNNFDRVIKHRRWLHQNPEIGFNEHNTSKYCKKVMSEYGYKINYNNKMKTGFTCDYGQHKGPTLAIRCDMDALPIQEINNIDYKSKNVGVSHACGHDAHMANVLGLAAFIQDTKKNIKGCLRFIFQPAEEIAPGGAVTMIKAGAINNVDHIIGAHILPSLLPSKIGVRHGPMAAAVDQIVIKFKGPGGHTSRPLESVDLIWAQSHLIISLEESIRHGLDPSDQVVLAFGKVEGGFTCNVLPDEIILEGTLRYLNQDLQNKLHNIIKDTISSIEKLTKATIDFHIPHSSPGLFNDEDFTNLIISSGMNIIGKKNVIIMEKSSMGGEDFAYYLEKIPGAYFRIGCNDGKTRDIHTNDFNLDEHCMITGIKVFAEVVDQYFK